MSKQKILGLDLGSNSIGWAFLEADKKGVPTALIDTGCRIFPMGVEGKPPTPKNVKRRERRLARRVLQRRARRKQKMLNYLIAKRLLPATLKDDPKPEGTLNQLGDPYLLRKKALDRQLTPHELGRVFLHLVQRRGFLSNRKTLLGDMADDPDVLAVLAEDDEASSIDKNSEETDFKQDISQLRDAIHQSGSRTLGEYLATIEAPDCRRNRLRQGEHLRTDRQMYKEELDLIVEKQASYHVALSSEVKQQLEEIIFYQRPLKLRADRIGKCSLEPSKNRARIARLEYQNFRILQDLNNLQYFEPWSKSHRRINEDDRAKLLDIFDKSASVTFPAIRKSLGLDKKTTFNLESEVKKLKGNTTASAIRQVFEGWDTLDSDKQHALVEDLLTIQKKSVLKNRLIAHWGLPEDIAVRLCMVEFEPGHGNLSVKAMNKLLPHLETGLIYSAARQQAGYGYELEEITPCDKLGAPPELPNPIVMKALHELRRVVNALIAEYGKPDIVRLEMARDLEMNTKRYAAFIKQQKANTKVNNEAGEKFAEVMQASGGIKSRYPGRTDKLKYRLWKEQDHRCAYSGKTISQKQIFGPEVEIDHIIPYSQSIDDSYMNKVVCFASENRFKGNRTPCDAWSGTQEKWDHITQQIARWPKGLDSKRNRFYISGAEVQERDFIGSQLTDTRYISKEAGKYIQSLGVDLTYPRGVMTSWLRRMWSLNSLLGKTSEKERTDHRHHALDAAVTACIDRRLYGTLVSLARDFEQPGDTRTMSDIYLDPPWPNLRIELENKLDAMIVSHIPQRKITGALHEETGVGYIEGIGTVYRKNLDPTFDGKQAQKIIDDVVREQVINHLARHGDDPKKAFAEDATVYHKDGRTPIRRVRVVQAKTNLEKLSRDKFGVRDKQGDTFRWMAYGNLHHVEILRHRSTGKYTGKMVTMMEAASRARGLHEPLNIDQGSDYLPEMVLHKNDLVAVNYDGTDTIYRVQILEQPSNLTLRLHTAAGLKNPEEGIRKSVSTLMTGYKMRKLTINAIGRLKDDQTNSGHQ